MDRLAEKLEASGVPARVYRWEAIEWAYRDIMKRRPDSVMIMGHSMGALTTINLANRLKNSGIRVAYIGTIDIPGPAAIVPANVEVAENYYHAFPVYGQLAAPSGYRGKVRNQYVWGEVHITMDKSKKVHAGALDFVASNRGAAQTMQAYAAPAPEPAVPDVIGQVDSVLAASGSATTMAPGTSSTVAIAWPAVIPVPSPAPRSYAMQGRLPPIE